MLLFVTSISMPWVFPLRRAWVVVMTLVLAASIPFMTLFSLRPPGPTRKGRQGSMPISRLWAVLIIVCMFSFRSCVSSCLQMSRGRSVGTSFVRTRTLFLVSPLSRVLSRRNVSLGTVGFVLPSLALRLVPTPIPTWATLPLRRIKLAPSFRVVRLCLSYVLALLVIKFSVMSL